MTLERFFEDLQYYPVCDYLVEVHSKYEYEDHYAVSNEVLYCNDHYEWLNDWYEGQKYIKIFKFIPIQEIEIEGVCYG